MVAVSGGVDSMVLLDLLRQKPNIELVVAHYNHGIRDDADVDERLVRETAGRFGLPFECAEGRLGVQASEAFAREQRYAFLHAVCLKHAARAIVTAHHQDDLIETIILALMRGTGRKGLSALHSTRTVVRPLLNYSKTEIISYAKDHGIQWNEDSTNATDLYKRNYVRHAIAPKLDAMQRQWLVSTYDRMLQVNKAIDTELADLHGQLSRGEAIDRYGFIMLPHDVAKEYIAYLLRLYKVKDMTAKTITRLVIAAKTGRSGAVFDIDKTMIMEISRKNLRIVRRHARNSGV